MKGYIDYMMTWTDADGVMHSQAPDRENPEQVDKFRRLGSARRSATCRYGAYFLSVACALK
jgi:hypothetical protein